MRVPAPRKFRTWDRRHVRELQARFGLSDDQVLAMRVVAAVLPFRVNDYVLEELIDWSRVPDDPIFQLTFPQRGMLEAADFDALAALVARDAPAEAIEATARAIQRRLNPHPAGQLQLNVPSLGGRPLQGVQHKYRETVLFFPSQGQTCHAYCTYCFRWAQFVGVEDLRFASREAEGLVAYLAAHPEVTSVLFTGGDPLVMRTAVLRRYLEPLLRAELPKLVSIRVGSKALAWWPYRFLSDPDADDLLRLFEEVVGAGLHLAFMAHVSHPRELETPAAREAFRRVRMTGATIRCQAPLVRHVNDDAAVWEAMWRGQVKLGAVPYYMFVERDTGPRNYFEVPLARAVEIFRDAYARVSGLARTVRGPSMSATPGKVLVDGVADVGGQRAFVLRFLQARDPAWVGRPFFAQLDAQATWLDQLRPLEGKEFFFEAPLRRLRRASRRLEVLPAAAGSR
ncbi:MAG: lysine 2,3-aminomutase [Armatimonadota bacterium]|nr:lysine 2,3-aminomutase [Armatimonadota bacterium]